ncbi:type VI secretion system ATPase TssH [Microbulbifer sp. 2205BS26-8]|uniref:type VI secretion system ATPase TssH n=1 Tax=Microbulbifer sp. 2205BS26-8 TaxID=3064386 RepID=UPI00273DBF8B|nr:type VI secretion system ATPase TssH [Microbulbifer sp. 2205BS26-8]MDP5208193.1 type VI secretion system ATPase TssH [Microbulbifer sp. 2205BS26-8]
MIHIDLKRLVDNMTPYMRDALEGAAGLCLAQNQYNVELEHWMLKLLDRSDTDLYLLVKEHGGNPERLAKQLATAIAGFRTGSSRPPALSPTIVEVSKNAWMLASIDYGHRAIGSGHFLAALILEETSRRQILESCPELKNIAPESLRETARAMFGQSGESSHSVTNVTKDGDNTAATVVVSKAPALDKYTINLTERARQGEVDPVLGRDEEIRQCIDILTRRRQNNPILTGEAGVGKTAVVEGFALRIASGDVPEPLRGVTVRTLDLGLLQAGASVKGEFENRLKSVIGEIRASATPIILFIDEAHTMIGAGGKEGQGDAANLLKPALARGELRTLAATTWAEYKKYFERDPALTRRFQVVKVEEPGEENAIDMMRGIANSLEQHHKVRILDEAIIASVKLSHRYIPGRQLPDKSVSLLDTACARVALSQSSTPGSIEDARNTIARTETTLSKLERENAALGGYEDELAELNAVKQTEEQRLTTLEQQLVKERELVGQIRNLRDQIDAEFMNIQDSDGVPDAAALADCQQQLKSLSADLLEVQGNTPLIQPAVDEQAIAAVVANWTGIPLGKMVSDEIIAVKTLAERLNKRIIGQPHAIEAIAQAIRTARAGLTDPRKPVGVFMFCGTSGVGKTETALALADELFGGEQNITTINMAEFKEEHKVSMLLGSPPGYVGYGEGGVLTEAARRKPYSVILLDEIEKAHPGVQDIFYNLFDKGSIKDGEGRDIDFKNTVIIMTSNAGEEAIRAIFNQVEERPEPEVLLDNIRSHLLQKFKPAFLGRSNVIAYYPLDDEDLMTICKLHMCKIEKRIGEHYGASFSFDENALINIVARCHETDTGARNIEVILNRTILPELASVCLDKMAKGETVKSIRVSGSATGDLSYNVD